MDGEGDPAGSGRVGVDEDAGVDAGQAEREQNTPDAGHGEAVPLQLRFKLPECGPGCVRRVLLLKGWEEVPEEGTGAGTVEVKEQTETETVDGADTAEDVTEAADHSEGKPRAAVAAALATDRSSFDWHLHWRSSRFKPSDYNCALPYQRVNHFPKSGIITRKDHLLRQMRQNRSVFGDAAYNFTPEGFLLPNEYTRLVAAMTADERRSVWICKPSDSSRGRKIFLLSGIEELTYDQSCVIQRYVDRPLLVGGYKFDIRLYVLVTSVHPLRAYVYRSGIARFGTQQYTESQGDLSNLFAHLTNSSINKNSPALHDEKGIIGAGCKWDFEQLKTWLNETFKLPPSTSSQAPSATGANADTASEGGAPPTPWDILWEDIRHIVNLTLLLLLPEVPVEARTCFELFGFDILVDEALRAWVLEVNCSPALSLDGDVDMRVKLPLISDTVDIVDFPRLVRKYEADLVARQEQEDAERNEIGVTTARLQRRRSQGEEDTSTATTTAPTPASDPNADDNENEENGDDNNEAATPPPPQQHQESNPISAERTADGVEHGAPGNSAPVGVVEPPAPPSGRGLRGEAAARNGCDPETRKAGDDKSSLVQSAAEQQQRQQQQQQRRRQRKRGLPPRAGVRTRGRALSASDAALGDDASTSMDRNPVDNADVDDHAPIQELRGNFELCFPFDRLSQRISNQLAMQYLAANLPTSTRASAPAAAVDKQKLVREVVQRLKTLRAQTRKRRLRHLRLRQPQSHSTTAGASNVDGATGSGVARAQSTQPSLLSRSLRGGGGGSVSKPSSAALGRSRSSSASSLLGSSTSSSSALPVGSAVAAARHQTKRSERSSLQHRSGQSDRPR